MVAMRERTVRNDYGVSKEVKDEEYGVAVTPDGTRALRQAGHQVLIQAMAGEESRFVRNRSGRSCRGEASKICLHHKRPHLIFCNSLINML